MTRMIEKFIVVITALLSQANILPQDNFFGNFIKDDLASINESGLKQANWLYYNSNKKIENILQPLPYKSKNYSDFEIDAKSALVLDSGTNTVLYSKDQNRKLPIASVTKIMTALVVLDKINLEDIIAVSKNAMKAEGDKDGLREGEKIKAKDLLKIMLVNSNNIAAEAFAEHISGSSKEFIELMNNKVILLGLKNTRFFNPSGLDQVEENYSTAFEISQLFDYALKRGEIWDILRIQKEAVESYDGKIKHNLKNTNQLLGKLSNIEGGKTGFTDNAGECLALVVGDPEENHKIISVVLNSKDRFAETEKLVNWVFKNYKW